MNHFLHDETSTGFNYNSDLSGDVYIRVRGAKEVAVPGYALLAFIAEYVRSERIAALEQAGVEELLLEMWGMSKPK